MPSMLTRVLSCIAAVAVASTALVTPAAGESLPELATPSYADVQPDALPEIAEAGHGLPRYRIDAELEAPAWDSPARIMGTIAIDWVNPDPEPAAMIPLRLYANAPAYDGGGIDVTNILVGGLAVEAEPSGDGTVLVVPLPDPVAPGGATTISARFATTVPVDSTAGFGIFSVKPASRTMALGHWYPMLAGSDDDGWSLEPLSRNGDPIFSPAAFYDVTLRAPAGIDVVATGVEVASQSLGGTIERSYGAGPARDMTLVAGEAWTAATTNAGGVRVTAYAAEGNDPQNEAALAAAVAALEAFGERFGPYPFRELDVVQMDLAGAAGMEFPGLVLIGSGVYGSILGSDALFAETVVAHEVAHQWWYGIVGSNNHHHAFIDEGIAEWAGVALYLESRYGPGVAATVWDDEVLGWWERSFARDGDFVVDAPTDAFANRTDYAAAVYPKAALGFAAIRAEIGDDAFFAALANIVRDRAFGVVEPGDVRQAFESACACELGPLWRTWFESASWTETTP